MLDRRQRAKLLEVARESVVAAAKSMPYSPPGSDDPGLQRPAAAFVTLRRGGELRGCIGVVEAREPLIVVVAAMARAAATEDYRFRPVHLTEVNQLTIEVSVLTPPERVEDARSIRIGTDGLIIEEGGRRGLLLPQVPVEWGWTREQYLDQVCLKAGLPKGWWRKGGELYRFQAEVFSEAE